MMRRAVSGCIRSSAGTWVPEVGIRPHQYLVLRQKSPDLDILVEGLPANELATRRNLKGEALGRSGPGQALRPGGGHDDGAPIREINLETIAPPAPPAAIAHPA